MEEIYKYFCQSYTLKEGHTPLSDMLIQKVYLSLCVTVQLEDDQGDALKITGPH